MQDFGGQFARHHPLEDCFLIRSAHFEPLWQPGRELDNPVVEERWSNFERVRHTHAIYLVEKVIGQIEQLIEHQITVAKAGILSRGKRPVQTPEVMAVPVQKQFAFVLNRERTVPEKV